MPLCIALVHSHKHDSGWAPCAREAIPRSLLCADHRDAIDGALLGYYFMLETRHAEKYQREKARRERMSIGDALRRKGIDEHTIARNYKHVMVKLKANDPEAGTVQKLFVDVLKECSRQLEASDESARAPSRDAPVIVHLVHNVPRPERPPTEPGK